MQALRRGGRTVLAATSSTPDEAERYIDLVGAGGLIDGMTTAADVDAIKPDPDLVRAALDAACGCRAVVIGDSVWDCEGGAAGGPSLDGLLTGGFGRDELLAAGAVAVDDRRDGSRSGSIVAPLRAGGGTRRRDGRGCCAPASRIHLQLMRREARPGAAGAPARARRRAIGSLLGDVAAELREQEALVIALLRQLGAGRLWLHLAVGSLAERGRARDAEWAPAGRLPPCPGGRDRRPTGISRERGGWAWRSPPTVASIPRLRRR